MCVADAVIGVQTVIAISALTRTSTAIQRFAVPWWAPPCAARVPTLPAAIDPVAFYGMAQRRFSAASVIHRRAASWVTVSFAAVAGYLLALSPVGKVPSGAAFLVLAHLIVGFCVPGCDECPRFRRGLQGAP